MGLFRVAAAFGTAALVVMSVAHASTLPPAEGLADAAAPDAGAACVKWHGEARSNGFGYKHVVVIENGCKKPATCAVSTDVNPTVQNVTVAPATTEEVVTFFDSPVSAFVPNVSCKI
ncbi:MAG: hypothetical protein ACXVEF_12775 [Polyangiales bacterium]